MFNKFKITKNNGPRMCYLISRLENVRIFIDIPWKRQVPGIVLHRIT